MARTVRARTYRDDMSEPSADNWPLAPTDRVVVRVRCRVVDAELAADRLFGFGASAVGEQQLPPDEGGAGRGADGSLSDWVELTADVDPAVVPQVVAALPDVEVAEPAGQFVQQAEPYVVGGRLVVRPPDVPVDVAAAGLEPGWSVLVVDAGQAFGSGTHATTRACLAEVLRLSDEGRLEGVDVLDVGCGTGVLGLAALMLGARGLVGVDTDPAAVAATRANAEANELLGHTRTATSLELVSGTFGLVLANLLAPVFDELGPQIATAVGPGGVLVASGVLQDQVDRVLTAAPDLVLDRHEVIEGWAVLTLTRPL